MTKTDEQIVEAWGKARIKDGRLQIKQINDIGRDIDGLTVAQAITFLGELNPDAKLDIFAENNYGDYMACIFVESWFDVWPEERERMIGIIDMRERQQRERDEADLRRIRATRPDLFS